MTREEILDAIEAWQKENNARTAFVIMTDEEKCLSKAIAGKGTSIMASIVAATMEERTRVLIEEALKFGKCYPLIKEHINEEVEKELKEAKEKGEGD